MSQRNVVIDCDTGVDDAIALLLALRSPQFNVVGITNVAGNVGLDNVVRNTLMVVEHAQKSVPVFRGAATAILSAGERAPHAHGGDGLGDIGFPAPSTREADENAVDFLVRAFMEASEPLELITLGPLTNVALALIKEPRLKDRIPSIVMMAGGITNGNATPAAEFNIYCDPEAADIVFRSPIPKTMVALEPIRDGAKFEPEDVEAIVAADTPWCWVAGRLLRWQQQRWQRVLGTVSAVTPPDPGAMAHALDPTVTVAEMCHVAIELRGEHTRGMTLVDRRPWRGINRPAPEPNVNVVLRIHADRFRQLCRDILLAP